MENNSPKIKEKTRPDEFLGTNNAAGIVDRGLVILGRVVFTAQGYSTANIFETS